VDNRDGFREALNPFCGLLPDKLFDYPTGKSARVLIVACPAPFEKIF
jgi:hypothetical protein